MAIRGGIVTNSQAKSAELTAVIIRADGTRVQLGTVAYWNKNPLKRWAWAICSGFRRMLKR